MKATPVNTALVTLIAPIAWGTTYLTITELLPSDRPLFIATARVLPAGLLLAATGIASDSWRPRGEQWWRLAVLAAFNFAIFFPLLIAAISRLPGGVVASIGGAQPLLVTLIAWVVARTPIRRRDLAVGTIAVAGVALVVIRPGASIEPVGVLYAVLAVASFSIGIVLTKTFPTPPHRLAATGWQLLLSAVIILPLTLIVEGPPPAPTVINLAAFAYLSLIATGIAFVIWFAGISKLPIAAPPLLALAAPITGAALGWIILDEALSPIQILGFVLTIGAITHGATTASAYTDMKSQTPSTTSPFVTATYEVPLERHKEFLLTLRNAELAMRAEGLITEWPALRLISREDATLILEVFQWTDATSFEAAQRTPSVLVHWAELEKLWRDGGFGMERFPESRQGWAQYDTLS